MLANKIRFSSSKRLVDKTSVPLTEITPNAYTTSASARPQVLSNGWIVSVFIDEATNYFMFYKSEDNGTTWQLLGSRYRNGLSTNLSVSSYGNNVYCIGTQLLGVNSSAVSGYRMDVTNFASTVSLFTLDSTQNDFAGCSIAVNPTNGHLTAAWSSKNATYPNGFNIRSAKSVDGGVTWTRQNGTAGVDQVTYFNDASLNFRNPYVIYKNNGHPSIIYDYTYDGRIRCNNYSGTEWQTMFTDVTVYQLNGYGHFLPSATVQRYGANVGRIWVAWHGTDATDNTRTNIRVSRSDDNGVTWSAMTKLTTGNTYDNLNTSITSDKDGNVYVYFQGKSASNTTFDNIKYIKWDGSSWGSVVQLATQNVANVRFPSTCDNYYDFEQPITIWQDNQNFGDKVLLHMNGANNSTVFTDDSGKVWTATNAIVSTAQSKFGGASGYFNGSSYISTPDTVDFTLGADMFTIDFWMKVNSTGIFHYIFGQNTNSASGGYRLSLSSNGDLNFTSGTVTTVPFSSAITDNNWHHVAIIRNSAKNIKIYVDGVGGNNVVDSNAYPDMSTAFTIGRAGDYTSNYFAGYIDEFRFTKGVARWTSNFTPPTAEGVYYNNPPSVDVYGKWYQS